MPCLLMSWGATAKPQLQEAIVHFLVVEVGGHKRDLAPLGRSNASQYELVPYLVGCFANV